MTVQWSTDGPAAGGWPKPEDGSPGEENDLTDLF